MDLMTRTLAGLVTERGESSRWNNDKTVPYITPTWRGRKLPASSTAS